MSATIQSSRPDPVAAFKQRHEAYVITASISETVSDAKAMMDLGMAKETANNLVPLMDQIERNPEARRMLAARAPAELEAAQSLAKEAVAESPFQVKTTHNGEWRTQDGLNETQLSLGRSDSGFHYAVEVSHRGGEPVGDWSRPFRTATAARKAGQAAENRELGINISKHPTVERTPRAEHAARLESAAATRKAAAIYKRGDMPELAALSVQRAKEIVAKARQSRQNHEFVQQRSAAVRSAMDRGR